MEGDVPCVSPCLPRVEATATAKTILVSGESYESEMERERWRGIEGAGDIPPLGCTNSMSKQLDRRRDGEEYSK